MDMAEEHRTHVHFLLITVIYATFNQKINKVPDSKGSLSTETPFFFFLYPNFNARHHIWVNQIANEC